MDTNHPHYRKPSETPEIDAQEAQTESDANSVPENSEAIPEPSNGEETPIEETEEAA